MAEGLGEGLSYKVRKICVGIMVHGIVYVHGGNTGGFVECSIIKY